VPTKARVEIVPQFQTVETQTQTFDQTNLQSGINTPTNLVATPGSSVTTNFDAKSIPNQATVTSVVQPPDPNAGASSTLYSTTTPVAFVQPPQTTAITNSNAGNIMVNVTFRQNSADAFRLNVTTTTVTNTFKINLVIDNKPLPWR